MRSQRAVIFPLVSPPCGLKVVGREKLEGMTGPVLFASNHNLGLDNPLIIKAVPLRWRRRMAVVGPADLWKNPVWWIMNPLLGNAFPLAREGSVRPSLAIMDNGWSVLIYPEGELTVGGPIKPFMNGTGLVAVEGRIPVVPLRLYIHELGFPTRFPVIRLGRVEVRLGEPLSFSPGTNYNAQAMVSPTEPAGGATGMLVTAVDVVDEANDNAMLAPMMERAEETTGTKAQTTLADAGYFAGSHLEECASRGQQVVVSESRRRFLKDPYHKDQFTYDEQSDSFTCPQGQTLHFVRIQHANGVPLRGFAPKPVSAGDF